MGETSAAVTGAAATAEGTASSPGDRPTGQPPDAPGKKQANDRQAGERRLVTVLFCDLVGSTAMSRALDPEDLREVVAAYQRVCGDAAIRHGGHIAQYLGDGVLMYFGYPQAHEDDALRAVRCSLDILAGLERLNQEPSRAALPIRARLGAHTGLVVVSALGRGETTEQIALGDTPNIAARLQNLAEPGTLVVGDATHRLLAGFVLAESLGKQDLKGIESQIPAWRITGFSGAQSRLDAAADLTPYVGREAELESLERFVTDPALTVRACRIIGEPGIGKSRLVLEVKARLDRGRTFVLKGGCSPDGQQTPLLPFIEVVRSSFNLAAGESEAMVARKLDLGLTSLGLSGPMNIGLLMHMLGMAPPADSLAGLDGTLIGLRTRDLLLATLAARCRLGPVALVLEDLHWVDSASEEVISRIVALADSLPLRIIVTCRPEYESPWCHALNVLGMPLMPLTADATSRIVRGRLGADAMPDELGRLVAAKAEGNALFAEEIASFLLERNIVRIGLAVTEFDAGAISSAMPASIQSLLSSRVDRLSADDRALLQAAAVVGRRFAPELLDAVAGVDGSARARLEAIRALDLVHPDEGTGEYAFKHALIRDSLYDSMLRPKRIGLHQRVAEEIERRAAGRLTEFAESLAGHYAQSERTEKAFTYLVMAGRKCLGVYSLDEADHHLQAALRLAKGHAALIAAGDQVRMLVCLAELCTIQSEPRRLVETVEEFRPAMEACGDSTDVVIVMSHFTFASNMMREFRRARATSEDALAMALRLGDPRALAYGRAAYVSGRTYLLETPERELEALAQAALAECENVDEPFLHSHLRMVSCWNFLLNGNFPMAARRAREMQDRGRQLGDPRATSLGLSLLALIALYCKNWDEARVCADEALRTAVVQFERDLAYVAKGSCLVFQGPVAEGQRLLISLRESVVSRGFDYVLAGLETPLAVSLIKMGRIREGIGLLHAAIGTCDRIRDMHTRTRLRVDVAEILVEMLGSKARPPLAVLWKNLRFILWLKTFGKREVARILQTELSEGVFSKDRPSMLRMRIEFSMGKLELLRGRTDGARNAFLRARELARTGEFMTVLKEIDAAMAALEAVA